ncbi:MAG: hypothetical protein AAF655_04075 [Bacteroidota bacterium]
MGLDVNSTTPSGSLEIQLPLITHGLVGTTRMLAVGGTISFLLFIGTLSFRAWDIHLPVWLTLIPFILIFLFGMSLTVMQFTGQLSIHKQIGRLLLRGTDIEVGKGATQTTYHIHEDSLTVYIDYRGYNGEWLHPWNRDLYASWYAINNRGYGDRNAITIKKGNKTLCRHYFLLDSPTAKSQLEGKVEAWKQAGLDVRKRGRSWR